MRPSGRIRPAPPTTRSKRAIRASSRWRRPRPRRSPSGSGLAVAQVVAVVDRLAGALVGDGLAVAVLDLGVLRLAHIEDVEPPRPAVDEPAAEPDADRVLTRAAVDVVVPVAGVDPVVAGARVDDVALMCRVAGVLVVGPDDVMAGGAVDHVVAVAAEQLVVAGRAGVPDVLVAGVEPELAVA